MKKFWNRRNVITIIAGVCALALMVGAGMFAYNEYGAQKDTMAASSFNKDVIQYIAEPGAAAVDEKAIPDRCDIHMESYGSEKIKVIKIVREYTGLGLKETKELVEKAPVVIKEDVPKQEALTIQSELQQAGATVVLK